MHQIEGWKWKWTVYEITLSFKPSIKMLWIFLLNFWNKRLKVVIEPLKVYSELVHYATPQQQFQIVHPLSRLPFFCSDDVPLFLTEDLNTSTSLIASERSGWGLAPFLVAAVGLGVVVMRDVVVFGLGVGLGSIWILIRVVAFFPSELTMIYKKYDALSSWD